jgi:hypothetical protein
MCSKTLSGGGILHIEEPPEEVVMKGGLFHGFQLWVSLPGSLKMTNPRYQDIRAGQVKLLSSPDGGTLPRTSRPGGSAPSRPGPPPSRPARIPATTCSERRFARRRSGCAPFRPGPPAAHPARPGQPDRSQRRRAPVMVHR